MYQIDGPDIFVDLLGYKNPSNAFHNAVRPDLVLQRNHHIVVIELTCCFKTNLVHSRNFKIEKYKSIKRYSKVTVKKIETFSIKMPPLGFVAKIFKRLEKILLKININCN